MYDLKSKPVYPFHPESNLLFNDLGFDDNNKYAFLQNYNLF